LRCNSFRTSRRFPAAARGCAAAHRQTEWTGKATETHPDQQTVGKVAAVQTELRYERWYLPLSVPLGLGPSHSEVRVEAGTLHVKMGWAFDADIPLASITQAEAANERVFTWGVHYSGGRWLVNGSGKGLVALTIEPSVQAKVWIKSVTLRSLWVSVTDPDALIAACTTARA
jgi:hypothetical protein